MHESGIFASLPPGQFTVILAGKDDGTGVALVEIYNLKWLEPARPPCRVKTTSQLRREVLPHVRGVREGDQIWDVPKHLPPGCFKGGAGC
jgi:hypothetical protein